MLHLKGIHGHQSQIKRLSLLLAKGSIPQAMLFSGIEGIGKRKIAESFLTALFCPKENRPCYQCPPCKQILADTFPDVIRIQPNEKGTIPIGTEEKKEYGTIRWFIDRLGKKSITGTYAALIDGLDRATVEGQNALLKTIEEPAENTHIILITSNRTAILPTILSRCFEMKFLPLEREIISTILRDAGGEQEETFIAEISGGSALLAHTLTRSELLDEVMQLCRELSSFIDGRGEVALQHTALQKSRDSDQLIDIVIHLYRLNVRLLIQGYPRQEPPAAGPLYNRFLKEIYIDDLAKVTSLIKIFLALKKGRTYNLNLRNALKGMLYSLHGQQQNELHHLL